MRWSLWPWALQGGLVYAGSIWWNVVLRTLPTDMPAECNQIGIAFIEEFHRSFAVKASRRDQRAVENLAKAGWAALLPRYDCAHLLCRAELLTAALRDRALPDEMVFEASVPLRRLGFYAAERKTVRHPADSDCPSLFCHEPPKDSIYLCRSRGLDLGAAADQALCS